MSFFCCRTIFPPTRIWKIYRWQGYMAVVWFDSSPMHHHPPSKLDRHTQEDWERETTWWRKRRSPIIRRREGLALYKLFNTLCSTSLAIATFEPGHQVLATVLRVTARKPCPQWIIQYSLIDHLPIATFEPGHQVLATVLRVTARKPCPL
jgi:hypothetical protein